MMTDDLFPNEYQVLRAQVAASCLSGAMSRPWATKTSVPDMADAAILAADVLLDRLGLVDPDQIPP